MSTFSSSSSSTSTEDIDLSNHGKVVNQLSTDDDSSSPDAAAAKKPSPNPLTLIDIKDENVALNVIVSFLNVAQKRGAFSIDESAKIWECVQKFINK